ncbi:winged helix-turn-helix domain-containing protein [Candidatus Enterococcus mansonii]|uniref:OmpR/PhoB-type domain-containing protein n=1 Tax=Candidatus Enterococcus mansonii TaxID=1834181 RepID=A0A242CEA2_9ENTE|nr:winged helix-turn-helix domain-containing protein [Enterococcus sp. 4G2_DIV0659]OTO08448.1 hypothetical protein A5880_001448 [Enterococcus sp. 4G2_DIV0659]
MKQVVLIALNKEFAQPFKEEVERLNGQAEVLLPSELDYIKERNLSPDILCILESETCSAGEVGQLLLQAKQYKPSYLWVFSLSDQLPYRLVYAGLGADGTICMNELAAIQELFRFTFCQIEKVENLKNNLLETAVNEKQEYQNRRKTKKTEYQLKENNLSICIDETEIFLTRLEFRLMSILKRNCGKTVTYQELGNFIWNEDQADWQTSRYRTANIIYKIRYKIEQRNQSSDFIQTVRSMGYRLGNE